MESFLAEIEYLTETGTTENGDTEYELEPAPECIDPEEITLDVAYRACYLLQVDPEKVLFDNAPVELPERPPLMHVEAFVNLLVRNAGDYELVEMHPTEVKVLMATVTDYFIAASHGKSAVERPS